MLCLPPCVRVLFFVCVIVVMCVWLVDVSRCCVWVSSILCVGVFVCCGSCVGVCCFVV